VAALLCALLLTLGAAACGGSSSGGDSQGSNVEDSSAPAAEDTAAAEEADDSGGGAVAVELPGLPIGGSATVVSDTLQCVDVGWSAPPDLPDWVSITVTGVEFDPSDGFDVSSESCPGDAPPCLASGVELTASDRCYVAVTWTGPTLDTERTMSFTSGRLTCQPDRVDECETFRDEVEAEGPQSIGLEPAPAELETDGGG
jgi:hypothetical protein